MLMIMFWMMKLVIVIAIKLVILPFKIVWFLLIGWWAKGNTKRNTSESLGYMDGFWNAILLSRLIK